MPCVLLLELVQFKWQLKQVQDFPEIENHQ